MNKQKFIALFVIFILIVCLSCLIWFGIFLHTPNASQKISAFMMGAEYLGSEGVLLQTKQNDCGPTALKMIFEKYRILLSLEEIEKGVGLTQKGSTMLALKEMAEIKGLKSEGRKLTLDEFLKQQFPVLLFVHNDHYVVVDSVKNREIFIRDPAIGRIKMEKSKLVDIWNGETLIFRMK
jgi:ABC-type bacteriocin/lantibiotic exporter with double-glycine peptidase domain